MGPNLLKGNLWDRLDKIEEIYWDTSRQIFTLSLINQIVCIVLLSHIVGESSVVA